MNVFFLVSITTCDKKHEQRINVKSLVKFKKTPTKCYKWLKEAYGKNSLSCGVFLNDINDFLKAERATKIIYIQVDLSLFQLHK